MSIFRRLFGKAPATTPASSALLRAGQSLGPWTDALGSYIARDVNPHLYEALREALPILDGAVNRLVTLDGIVRVEGGNDALVQRIERGLLESIPVNDAENGLQAAYASQGNELYEQGCGVVEMVMDARGRELVGLRVADSKGLAFDRAEDGRLRWWYRPPTRQQSNRADGSDMVEAVIRGGRSSNVNALLAQHSYVPLDPALLAYAVHQPEADNPYGVSLFRSMEFTAQLLLKLQVNTGRVWDRYGDPPFRLTYKTKNRAVSGNEAALTKRRNALAADLAAVLNAKRNGNSADFVQAIASDDDIVLEVIGAQDKILEIEMPARHMLEQIVSKTGVAAWLLGLQWTTAERLAQQQSEMMLQESRTRFERRKPGLRRIVETWLRGQGLTWRPGDWTLVQELPSLHDELKRAQAAFLNAQTDFMLRGGASGASGAAVPSMPAASDAPPEKAVTLHQDGSMTLHLQRPREPGTSAGKATRSGEDWAEDDPELPALANRTADALLAAWRRTEARTLAALGLSDAKAAKAGDALSWVLTPTMRAALMQLADELEIELGASDGALVRGTLDAWLRGAELAAAELGMQAVLEVAAQQAESIIRAGALAQARSTVTRTYREGIIDELAAGHAEGQTPAEVARRLRQRFGARDYDWQLLAHSELAEAASVGKLDEYAALDVTHYDYVTAGDSLVSSICRAHAAAGPYPLGDGPVPMRDSHPGCRCTVRAHLGDDD